MHVSIYKFFSLFKCKMLLWSELLPRSVILDVQLEVARSISILFAIGVNEVGKMSPHVLFP